MNGEVSDMSEAKVLFQDGNVSRVIRGEITSEDDFFFTITRRDGTVRIAKRLVLKVEMWNGSDERNDNHR